MTQIFKAQIEVKMHGLRFIEEVFVTDPQSAEVAANVLNGHFSADGTDATATLLGMVKIEALEAGTAELYNHMKRMAGGFAL